MKKIEEMSEEMIKNERRTGKKETLSNAFSSHRTPQAGDETAKASQRWSIGQPLAIHPRAVHRGVLKLRKMLVEHPLSQLLLKTFKEFK